MCRSQIRRVLVQTTGFISSWVIRSLVITLTHRQYSAVLHQLQFTVAHTLGFSVSTIHFPATDLDTQTVTVSIQSSKLEPIFLVIYTSQYEVPLHFYSSFKNGNQTPTVHLIISLFVDLDSFWVQFQLIVIKVSDKEPE
jgi:hypothetical protein